ncbi:Retrovirus-related Pol polyprotein from transposon TNT 1-94 [Anthophora plagiata]
MATANAFGNIEKLNENNYDLWKVQMKSVLVFNDLWQYVNGDEKITDANAHEWTRKDSKALALINLSVTYGQLSHVKKATTSKEAWDGLKEIFESRGPIRKAALYKQLLRMEKKKNVSMTQYVNEFGSKAEALEEAGIKLPDELLSIMLLSSLPAEYENFSVVIESRDDVPSLENLKVKLKEEEARQRDRDEKNNGNENNSDALLTKGSVNNEKYTKVYSKYADTKRGPRKFVKCFNCGKLGHKIAECRVKRKHNESHNATDAMTTIACNTEPVKSGMWCIDSGATKHMCNDESKFVALDNGERSKVYTAAENYVDSPGVGNVKLNVKINKHAINPVKLKNTLYVPGLRNNLVSVSSVTDNGYTVEFEKNRAIVARKDGSVALTATKRNNLYVVDEKENRAMVANDSCNLKLLKWHQRYGHVNVNDLKRMMYDDLVCGMDFESTVNEINCNVCARCKIHVQPFKQSNNRSSEVLHLVHSDICGPMRVESLGGARYFVTFVDDCSRYIETVMLRNRSEVLSAFKNYKRRVENETGRKIKILRTDNAKEYLSNSFRNFLEEEGVSRQLSVEHTPQQNGVAERVNRTLVEMARCMKLQANLPDSLWGELINTATYIRNRCATKSLNAKTPFEVWNGRKPYVGFLRTVGSKVIALNKGLNRGKFQPKGEEYVMVGYSHESKAYRLWKPGTKTIIKARDVKFFEKIVRDEEPLKDIFAIPNPPLDAPEEHELEESGDPEELSSEESENEDSQESTVNETNREPQRRRGRPKLLRTGQAGRPRKIYNTEIAELANPVSVNDIMNRADKKA